MLPHIHKWRGTSQCAGCADRFSTCSMRTSLQNGGEILGLIKPTIMRLLGLKSPIILSLWEQWGSGASKEAENASNPEAPICPAAASTEPTMSQSL